MNYPARRFKQLAVLGAGVMGAQIAAHVANAGIPVLLYELPAQGDDANANVNKALAMLQKLKPAPLAGRAAIRAISAANYAQHLSALADCDLVIEAISERLDWKQALYQQILPHLNPQAILASNTSGISVEALAADLPLAVQQRFCGVHFFNPPRYMPLVELVPRTNTQAEVLADLEAFLTTDLGKGVVRAKDTPSFIGNRVGVFSLLAVMHHAARLHLPFDLVDELTGTAIGRPKSATFRTADVVGLDTFAHVVNSMQANLSDDPWQAYYCLPAWMETLISAGALGQKTERGIYQKRGKDIQVLDPATAEYRPLQPAMAAEVGKILAIAEPAEKWAALCACSHPQAQFLVAIHLDLFHYVAVLLADIAHSARDVDVAMRWGYGWQFGPFELWQAAGWQRVTQDLQAAISAGQSMSALALPAWVQAPERRAVHTPEGSWSAAEQTWLPAHTQPVYARQQQPLCLLGEHKAKTQTVLSDAAVTAWHTGDEILVLSFNTPLHTINQGVLDGVNRALDVAEADFQALILWQSEAPFSAGANLKDAQGAAAAGDFAGIESLVKHFQQTSLRLRHSPVPTVAAVQGLVLGGGCEFMLHCDRTVAALESYIGLVEVGVGLIPGAGGCKEMAMRASDAAAGGDVFPLLARYFENIAMGKVSSSAIEAREWGYLRAQDSIIFNPYELLFVAKQTARALYASAYRPPLPRDDIRVAGRAGMANLQAQLTNMLRGQFISEYDALIGGLLAKVMCGDQLAPGTEVHQSWLLALEIAAFMQLAQQEKSQARISHMLATGKPLRN